MKLQYMLTATLVGVASMFTACSEDELVDNNTSNNGKLHTIEMQLNASRPDFDGERSSRAQGNNWENGDKLYLTFTANGSTSRGTAEYNASNDKWTVQYSGNLAQTTQGKLSAYYFESPISEGNTSIALGGKTAIFCDTLGLYNYNGQNLSASASLTPANSRMRFQGQPGDTIYLAGPVINGYYDVVTQSFSNYRCEYQPLIVSKTADKDGNYYTDYMYLTTNDEYKNYGKKVLVMNNNDAYTHALTDNNLKNGVSGYLTLPNTEGAQNWVKYNPFSTLSLPSDLNDWRKQTIANYIDAMIKIGGGDMTLGTSNDQVNVHMYPYYMMSVEVSNELYYAVMDEEPEIINFPDDVKPINKYPLDAGGTQLPYAINATEEGLTASLVNFVNKLNELTGLHFDFPYETEWEYAARGGQKSKNYSRIANWSRDFDSSSDWKSLVIDKNYNAKHHVDDGPVNELDIYGLCSNVPEACRYVGNYKDLSKFFYTKDNYSPNNIILFYWRGASAYECRYYITSYNYPYRYGHMNSTYNTSRGLRLVLRFQDNF